MGEKQYFYTDPLAAAWMAKHFGMRFQALYNNFYKNRDIDTVEELLEYGGGANLSIHPDSLPILAPLPGDRIEAEGGVIGIIVGPSPAAEGYLRIDCGYAGARWGEHCFMDVKPEHVTSILKRNGLPFHQPASEAA